SVCDCGGFSGRVTPASAELIGTLMPASAGMFRQFSHKFVPLFGSTPTTPKAARAARFSRGPPPPPAGLSGAPFRAPPPPLAKVPRPRGGRNDGDAHFRRRRETTIAQHGILEFYSPKKRKPPNTDFLPGDVNLLGALGLCPGGDSLTDPVRDDQPIGGVAAER